MRLSDRVRRRLRAGLYFDLTEPAESPKGRWFLVIEPLAIRGQFLCALYGLREKVLF